MSYTLAIGGNYQYIANRETIDLYDKFSNLQAAVPDAKRLMQNTHEREQSYGEYLETLIDWRLPQSEVYSNLIIEAGWYIVDTDGIAYVILDLDPPGTYDAPWCCTCRRVDILGLLNQVDWRRVNQTTNVYGDRITDPTTFPLMGHYPARIQPARAEVLDILGKRGLLNHYEIYVLPDLALSYGDLIIDTLNGNLAYKVVSWDSKQDLACALRIIAELVP